MKITDLYEVGEEGRLETRTIDDPQTDNENDNSDPFQSGMETGMEDGKADIDEPSEPTVSDELWSAVSNHNYVNDFDHSSNETLHPSVIAGMDKPTLTKLQKKIDDMIRRYEMDKDRVGLYNDQTYKYLSSLQSFIRNVSNEK